MVLRENSVDVVGLGLNATDTVLIVRDFPALGGKERVLSSSIHAGGQVATALVTCQRLGLRTRYVGKVGDDEGGKIQLASLKREGVDVAYTRVVPDTPNQFGHILVDRATGERTIFWDRDARLTVTPEELTEQRNHLQPRSAPGRVRRRGLSESRTLGKAGARPRGRRP